METSFDVVIVGAGPAGLSAALVLGRCRRRVVVCDAGHPRNASAAALHGFLSRDGVAPAELLRLGREQLAPYDTVTLRTGEATAVRRVDGRFVVTLGDGTRLAARMLLVATGLVDPLPAVEGLAALYGRSVFHCPYCDGWELRDQPLAVYGAGTDGLRLALELTQWSRDLVLCTDGPAQLAPHERDRLARHGVGVREAPVARLEGRDGVLERIVFAGGAALARRALFFVTRPRQPSGLLDAFGLRLTEQGTLHTGAFGETEVEGLYVAGDASHALQLAVVAAAEGAAAAFAINTALLKAALD